MMWTQVVNPLNNHWLSAMAAAIPVLFIFFALIVLRMKVVKASFFAIILAFMIAIAVYKMPVDLALLSACNGALYGLFPICWILITALFLFNITLHSGQFEIIKDFMASITRDRRLQALLIAFSFGAFLEGTAGFGAPVAITAALLVGLDFHPFYAAGICLMANTAPVAFGSIGIPITVASQVSSIPETAISQMVGRTLPVLSLFLPFYLVAIMCGFKKTREVLPAIIVSGVSFATIQWFCSNFLGPALPDILAGIGSIILLLIFLKFWHPKKIWNFEFEQAPSVVNRPVHPPSVIVKAWSPFVLLTIMILFWGIGPVKELLNSFGQVKFKFYGIHNAIVNAENNQPIPHIFTFNYLSAAGTAILISCLIAMPIVGLSFKKGIKIFWLTIRQLRWPVISVCLVLAFAYLLNDSGIVLTLAHLLSNTGRLFPLFAPVLGWLGVFITGSDTSSNALFSKVQAITAHSIGINPVVTVGANVSGGVIGKMISPSSIVVAAAAGNLPGKEPDLFRFTVKHSLILLIIICLLVAAQAYIFPGIIPHFDLQNEKINGASSNKTGGYKYIVLMLVILASFTATVMYRNNKKANLNPD